MISHNESEILRRFKCDECGKAFKFKKNTIIFSYKQSNKNNISLSLNPQKDSHTEKKLPSDSSSKPCPDPRTPPLGPPPPIPFRTNCSLCPPQFWYSGQLTWIEKAQDPPCLLAWTLKASCSEFYLLFTTQTATSFFQYPVKFPLRIPPTCPRRIDYWSSPTQTCPSLSFSCCSAENQNELAKNQDFRLNSKCYSTLPLSQN